MSSGQPNQFIDFERLVALFQSTHRALQNRATQAVNRHLVVRNWLFGRYIVEYEQNGRDRAQYGRGLIDSLAKRIAIRGASATNLRKFREFYRGFPIQQTASVELTDDRSNPKAIAKITKRLATNLTLSWSHYVTLLTIDDLDERRFYEIEANQNDWSVRELDRQINSSLYQRLALSRDKDEIRRLTTSS